MKKISKKLFEQTLKASIKYHRLKKQFDEVITDKFGFHYSDASLNRTAVPLDRIIDCIDYGGGCISYEEFISLMNEYLEERKIYGKD